MNGEGRSCAVTGANGYVGSRIAGRLREQGWRVVELRRDADGPERVSFNLESGVPSAALTKVDALVHCAYDFRPSRREEIATVNVAGSNRLFQAARDAGVPRIVLISTLSAYRGCRSLYGRAKLAVEELARGVGAAVVRPGLVWGDRPGGTLGALERAATSGPLVPLVGGRYLQYMCHEDDLARLVEELCVRTEVPPIPVVAAAERSLALRQILTLLANRNGRRPLFVPLPELLTLAGLRALESIGLRPGFRSDSLVSLRNQNPSPDFSATREIGLPFREFGAAQ